MFFSGLANIDFAGLGAEPLSPSAAADVLWSFTPPGTSFAISEADFKAKIGGALSGQYKLVKADTRPPNAIPDSTIAALAPEHVTIMAAMLKMVSTNGYYVVDTTQGQAASNTQVQSRQSGSTVLVQPQQPTQNTTNTPQQNVEFKYVQKRMNQKDRKRLILFLGIGAAIFAISMGLLAARSGE